jgi:peptidoglycan/LPS O-acetylase OafA/YrhL
MEEILSTWGGRYWETWVLPTFFQTFAAMACGLLVFVCAALPQAVARGIPRFASYLGTISYGLYLWHLPILLLLKRHLGLSEAPLAAATFVFTLAAAAISWHLLERPGIEWTRRAMRRASTGAVQ